MAVSGLNTSIAEAFGKVSVRERRLLAVVGLLVLVLAPIKAFDMRAQALAANEAAHADLALAKATARRASGQGVAAQLQKTRDEIREWSWEAPSVPVGQVMAQREMTDLAARGGLSGAEVKAAGRPEPAGAATLVGVEVSAPFNWSGLSGFLSGLSSSGKGFILESVSKTDDKEPRLKIVVRLPVVLAEPQAT